MTHPAWKRLIWWITPLALALALTLACAFIPDWGWAWGWHNSPTTPVEIRLWYGPVQHFGHQGNPQPAINILGSVAGVSPRTRLEYSLNGAAPRKLRMGCDQLRLARRGDFNIEIDRSDLLPGINKVTIGAIDGRREVARTRVEVHYTANQRPRLPLRIRWSEVSRIQDVAEVVDGNWRLVDGGVRTAQPYYDRVIAIGDQDWTDYEATTTVVFHCMLPDDPVSGEPYSHRAHASVVLRWRGHADDGRQPRVQWFPLGGLAMLRAGVEWSGNKWIWHGGESGELAEETEGRRIVLGRPYRIKARVQTYPGPRTRYSVKAWEAGRPEPRDWDLVAHDGENDLQSGSLLLVAHHADVTFGDVDVVALGEEPEREN